jgi:predicted TIM-barrel fold metal-dependent hydrolase
MFDYSSLPVVDDHCHPYVIAPSVGRYVPLDTFFPVPGDAEAAVAHRDTMVYQRWATRQLAGFLGCDATPGAVAEARAAVGDEREYVARLFADARLVGLVVDMGYPQPPIALEVFREKTPIPVAPLYRIEPAIKEMLDARLSYGELVRRFEDGVRRAIRDEGYVGLKSIIAYRTGLEIDLSYRDEAAGRRGLDQIFRQPETMDASKPLRDHLLCRTLELSIELGVPVQIHTGFGDVDVRLSRCNPAGLGDLLKAYREARVVLVHCYPFVAEASFLAAALPNVWCDLSLGIPFAPAAAERIFATALELAPTNRLLAGSDAFSGPEQSWLGARLAKTALGRVLADIHARDLLTEVECHEVAAAVLAGNARELYGLTG